MFQSVSIKSHVYILSIALTAMAHFQHSSDVLQILLPLSLPLYISQSLSLPLYISLSNHM